MGASGAVRDRARGRLTTSGGRSSVTLRDRLPLPRTPAAIQALAGRADPTARVALLGALQRASGNAATAGLLGAGGGPGPVVQRWNVGLAPGTSDCATIVNYLDAHSPYRATSGWARTRVTFSWSADPVYSGSGTSTTLTLANAAVTVSKSVDMPQWSPTNPAVQTAWTAMTADLRAHEARHEGIGDQWRGTLESRLSALSLPITNRAAWRQAVQAEFNTWLADHQADQNAIDPYTAILDCSGGGGEAASEEPGTPTVEATTSGGED